LLGTAMVVTVLVVAGLAYWDAIRESEAALRELANVEAASARSLGIALQALRAAGFDGDAQLAILARVERAGSARLFIHRAGEPTLRSASGATLASPRLAEAMRRQQRAVRIPREEAAAFGLPARTAMAGIAYADDPRGADLVTVSSAEHQRDREAWARRRLLLSVGAAAGLVLLFGGVAFHMQRKELLLERELAVAGLQRRSDERLARASKAAAFGTLAIGVAHEISTPLGVIAARAEQLQPRVEGDERLSGAVAAIASQAERIRQVIRGLLGLARGDAPSAERIPPAAIVAAALALVRHRLDSAGVPVAESIADSLPPVLGDEKLLEQAVVNLLLNACDACRSVGGSISVRVAQDGGDVTILVEDSGVGISSADAERALEPFFTTKAREGGSGLGLAIAREIVSNHRGTLTLAPMPGRGTRATIRLPPAPRAT
ncbi:MAG TPA: HAMP domain-containing sensor histidine kinase, partial [Polyangia bacterium]|nr:HAMP domain-containing sensor histidine kinase [Polyangia bacterium]